MKTSIEQELRGRPAGSFHELTEADVGRPVLANKENGFGNVLAVDVGKRCYLFAQGFSMENTAQRDARKVKP